MYRFETLLSSDDGWSLDWGPVNASIQGYTGKSRESRAPTANLYPEDIDCPSVLMKGLGETLLERTFYINGNADLMPALPELKA